MNNTKRHVIVLPELVQQMYRRMGEEIANERPDLNGYLSDDLLVAFSVCTAFLYALQDETETSNIIFSQALQFVMEAKDGGLIP